MYFKKLELVGFKSFFQKTTLHFEPGVTAVVGPNGCGKSNIFDSIRWVLGEQSVKALRGSDMQDVIFNGTDSKEPLGMAEVTLTFANEKRFFNVDHDEVVVTRRIFRSGESEYLLNKTPVRLKDILDLLMGTGIGAESYSLVEQGKIDLVLSVRPEDRRLVFDEAAGITKYKAQKKETLRKLEETEQNLLRVNDIITEVKRQIGSLERQANKARRYKEVFEELKLKEVSLANLQKKELLQQKDGLIQKLSQLETQASCLSDAIKETESKIGCRQQELKTLEENIMEIKNEILNLENLAVRNKEHIGFNQERIKELETAKKYLETQIEQAKNRVVHDEEKLNNFKEEYAGIKKIIEEKACILKDKENQLNSLVLSIKNSLENITQAKRGILDLATKITQVKNEMTDLTARHQSYLARKKRLEIEKAKVNDEKTSVETNLNSLALELKHLEKDFTDLGLKISKMKEDLGQEVSSLNKLNSDIEDLEKQRLTLLSQREFLEKLRTKYEDIGESLEAVVYLDRMPAQKPTGLVVKIKAVEEAGLKLTGEAKLMDLDTKRLSEKINRIEQELSTFKNIKAKKETAIEEQNQAINNLQQGLRQQEMGLANKKTLRQTVLEQFQKIKEEEGLILIDLQDADKELSLLEENLNTLKSSYAELEKEQKGFEDLISNEQNKISVNAQLKEGVLVVIAQTKTELEALNKRLSSEGATLKILEDTYQQDKKDFLHLENRMEESRAKHESLQLEIRDLENKIMETQNNLQERNGALKERQDKYQEALHGSSDVVQKIEADRKEFDMLKNKLYELQMQNKDMDFKLASIRDRIQQVYRIDLDSITDMPKELDEDMFAQEIEGLKEKLDAYGNVNLVAIEEYDELKKRYDFLTQQQNDLICAKESLHEVIQKINRTTKKMFLETFEKVREEFRNYFRLLFNGGDAQVFLIDAQDPLESGIEIICRPPGKKLQNVLLLSGGEKSLSAIALIFAIFKVKPCPFCVLDEIDAALDEANVDRYSRLLHEFSNYSQFIVITHNKRTIANANVMYGITMEESGVSKIVSVKFAQDRPVKDKEPEAVSV